ncbi:hypothetical protein MaudMau93_004876 [Microsporum audouinii]
MTEVDVRLGMNGLPASRMTPDPPVKRAFDELETTDRPNTATTQSNVENYVDPKPSPALNPSAIDTISSNITGPPPSGNGTVDGPVPSTPKGKPGNPNKKRKLSPASKEARERQKAEEKVKKEEERKAKEEEKRKRDEEKEEERKIKEKEKKKREEEREEKKRQREEEKQAKEDEKRRKEEEKQKKERSQMKLNAFFTKPKASPSSSNGAELSGARSAANSTSESMNKESNPASDFELEFPPFFIQSHVKLAPSHRFERDPSSLGHACEKLDRLCKTNFGLADTISPQQYNPTELFKMISYKRHQGNPTTPSVKDILLKLQEPQHNSIDLTDANGTATRVEKLLRRIPMKVLNFREDVRPPYQGTFTKRLERTAARKLCRNPFWRGVPDFNYDYDSEAEWEEPEEGEDIVSEGEDEISDDGEDDMDDFLDDGDDEPANTKRRMIVGDLEPKSTGICWAEDSADNSIINQHRMEIISGKAESLLQ